MTVADLRERMSGGEFLAWSVWYARKRQQQELDAMKRREV